MAAGTTPSFTCTSQDTTCAQLGALYSSTAGSSWTSNTNWATAASGTATDYCTFFGITCDSTGAVTQILLGSNNLTGTVPAYFGTGTAFASVNRVLLHMNNLVGPFPCGLFNLMLNFETGVGDYTNGNSDICCQSTGPLPMPTDVSCLNTRTSIIMRDTYNNPWGNLNGSIPESFGTLTNLTQLDFGADPLSGTLPASVVALCAQIASCRIPSTVTVNVAAILSVPPSTTSIVAQTWGGTLAGNIDFSSLTSLTALTALTYLTMAGVGLTGSIPNFLASLTTLNHLDLNGNALTGAVPDFWGNFPALTFLDLSSNQLNGTLPVSLGNALALQCVNLGRNQLHGTVSSAISALFSSISAASPLQQSQCLFFNLAWYESHQLYMNQNPVVTQRSGYVLSFPSAPGVAQLQATVASMAATLSSLTASLAALQVNLSAAMAACSAV